MLQSCLQDVMSDLTCAVLEARLFTRGSHYRRRHHRHRHNHHLLHHCFSPPHTPMARLIRNRFPVDHVRIATHKDLHHLFTTRDLQEHLFPSGNGFRMVESIHRFASQDRCYVISLDKESFSSGQVYQCPLGLCLWSNVFGEMTAKFAVSHLKQSFPRGSAALQEGTDTHRLWHSREWLFRW